MPPFIRLAALFTLSLAFLPTSGHALPHAFKKTVRITTGPVPKGQSWATTIFYPADTMAPTKAKIHWDGFRFATTIDGGATIRNTRVILDKNRQIQSFRITKEVTLSNTRGAVVSKTRNSAIYTVRRGVKANFLLP